MDEKNKLYKTSFLITKPSALQGAGTIFNVWGNYFLFNTSKTDQEADAKALKSDWQMVGEDFRTVIKWFISEK